MIAYSAAEADVDLSGDAVQHQRRRAVSDAAFPEGIDAPLIMDAARFGLKLRGIIRRRSGQRQHSLARRKLDLRTAQRNTPRTLHLR